MKGLQQYFQMFYVFFPIWKYTKFKFRFCHDDVYLTLTHADLINII